MQKNNEAKAKLLYDAIAGSNGFYANPVDPAVRSLMNVPFTIPSNPDLEKTFVKETEKLGLVSKRRGACALQVRRMHAPPWWLCT